MAKAKEVTTAFKVDIADLKKNIQEANKQVKLANSEFKLASAGMDDWSKDADGLSAKLKQLATILSHQKSILSEYEKRYEEVVKEQGEGSDAALKLQLSINQLKASIKTNEAAVNKYSDALDELSNESDEAGDESKKAAKGLDDLKDSAKSAEKSSSGLASSLGNLVKGGLASIGAAAAAAVGAFLASAEATKEYTREMGKLETAFTTNGHSVEDAKSAYTELVGILGETDQAVEASNHLAKLVDSEKDLQTWTDICTGVYATFGASLPIEGLTEAANETAKTGALTGSLADALNWAGVNEETFQKALDSCTSEQERQALITKTLNNLYVEASDVYKEVNADIIANNKATDALNASMAEVGKAAMPVMTTFKQMGAALLTELMPSVQELGAGLSGLAAGTDGAADQVGGAISGMLTQVTGKIAEMLPHVAEVGLSIITSLAQSLVNSLPQLASSASSILSTLVDGIITAAPQLLATGAQLLQFLYDSIMTGLPKLIQSGAQMIAKLGEGLATALPEFVNYALDALDGFADMLTTNLPILIDAGISFITNLAQGLVNALPKFIEKAPEIISKFANLINDNMPKILKAAVNIIVTLVKGIIQAIPTLVKNIPKIITAIVDVWEAFNWLSLGSKAITAVKNGITKMIGAVKGAGTSVVNGITSVIQSLPSKLLNFAKGGVSGMASAFRAGISTLKGTALNILKGIVNTFKPSSLLNIGKDLIRGLWNGISNMSGWIIGKLEGFGDSILSGIKSFFGIHSPSRVMSKEVGKPISEGVADGITKNKILATKAAKQMGSGVLKETKAMMSELDVQRSSSLEAELAYWDALTEASKEGAEEQVAAVSTVVDAEEELVNSVTELVDNYKNELQSTTDSLMDSCDLFGEVTKNTEVHSSDLLTNLRDQVKAYGAYQEVMQSLKGRITSEGLNAAIEEMGVDSLGELEALNAMTDEELQEYSNLYDTKYAYCNQIATSRLTELKAETETKLAEMIGVTAVNLEEFTAIFNGSMDSISQYIDWTVNKTADLEDDMISAGNMIMSGLISGMNSKLGELRAVVENIISQAAEAAKAAADIHSPSRLFANEIGKYIPLGIAEGIKKNTNSVTGAMHSLTAKTLSDTKSKIAGGLAGGTRVAQGAAGGNVTNNYFNQTNNSPKALNRLEIYRQSKNLLGYAGGGR